MRKFNHIPWVILVPTTIGIGLLAVGVALLSFIFPKVLK